MNQDECKKVIEALEGAQGAKLADGTYLDKDCKITIALTIMREEMEPDPPPLTNADYRAALDAVRHRGFR